MEDERNGEGRTSGQAGLSRDRVKPIHETRRILAHDLPYGAEAGIGMVVNDHSAPADHLSPGDVRIDGTNLIGDSAGGFADGLSRP